MSNKNGSEAAFPLISPDGMSINQGLTKREKIAAMAMQGLISTFNGEYSNELAKRSIQAADELLKQLDNEQH